jgi:hypothetical protein
MRRGDPIAELRRAIDGLPVESRRAMLDGVRANPIVLGAYTDSDGGICPMLAAHRHGGRTTFLAFARAWDRFGGAQRLRRATQREVDILVGSSRRPSQNRRRTLRTSAPPSPITMPCSPVVVGGRRRRARRAPARTRFAPPGSPRVNAPTPRAP